MNWWNVYSIYPGAFRKNILLKRREVIECSGNFGCCREKFQRIFDGNFVNREAILTAHLRVKLDAHLVHQEKYFNLQLL